MRNFAISLLFAAMALSWLSFGVAYAQPANAPPGNTSNATIPAGFNQPPAASNSHENAAGQQKSRLQEPGAITINGVN